jgi:phosphohistidine swiveling domain-containing protein
VEGESWLRISRDGEVLLEGTQAPGFARGFSIREGLDVVVGNAAAVRLVAGGERLGPLGDRGAVYAGSVVLDEGEARLIG